MERKTILNECKKRMRTLKLDKEMVIDTFIEDNRLMVSEYQNKMFKAVLYDVEGYTTAPQLKKAVDDFEKEYHATVYHVIGTPFRDFSSRLGVYTYSLLYVNNDDEEWEADAEDIKNKQTLAYVIGMCDEFGYIGVNNAMGGLYRTY